MQIGVVDDAGRVVGASRRKTKAEDGLEAVIDRIVEGVGTACGDAGVSCEKDVRGLGIGAPGAIDPSRGVVLEAVNLRWNEVPLAELLREKLGVPVHVDNDVNVAVYGEWKMGAGRGCDNLLGAWVGTGVGGGLVLDGKLFAGGFHTAGEIGHTVLLPGAPMGRRTLEQNCSRTAITDRLVYLIQANEESMLLDLANGDVSKIKSKLIAEAYRQGDDLVRSVVDEAASLLGVSLAGLVTVLSLERIVLGGGMTEAMGEPFVRHVRERVRAEVFPDRCRAVEVVASELEDDAGVVGAAFLAKESA